MTIIENILNEYVYPILVDEILSFAWPKETDPIVCKWEDFGNKNLAKFRRACEYGNYIEAYNITIEKDASCINRSIEWILLGMCSKDIYFKNIFDILITRGDHVLDWNCSSEAGASENIEMCKYILDNINTIEDHQQGYVLGSMAQGANQNKKILILVLNTSLKKSIPIDWGIVFYKAAIISFTNCTKFIVSRAKKCFDIIFDFIKHDLNIVDDDSDIKIQNKDDPVFDKPDECDIFKYIGNLEYTKSGENKIFNIDKTFRDILLYIMFENNIEFNSYIADKVGKHTIKNYAMKKYMGRRVYEWILRNI